MLAIGVASQPAAAVDPLATVRAFCLADGRGARLAPGSWGSVAALVVWELEPAWDRLYVVHGYEVGTPRTRGALVDVDVRYTIVSTIDAAGVHPGAQTASRTYALESDGAGGWRVRPPPPPPYVFDSQVDPAALAALLAPTDSPYLSNSVFVWQLLRAAGWDVPYTPVSQLPTAVGLTAQRTANIGDLVLYFDGDTPYHVGLVESDDSVVSATMNGGIRRTPFGAFAGTIRYLRPTAATPAATRAAVTPR